MSKHRIPGTRVKVSVAVRQRLIFAGFCLAVGLLVGGVTFLMINFGNNKDARAALGSNMGFENNTTEWVSSSGTWSGSTTYARTGTKSLKITQSNGTDGEIKNTSCQITTPASGTNQIVVMAYARASDAQARLRLGVANSVSGTTVMAPSYSSLSTSGFTRIKTILTVPNNATYNPVIVTKRTGSGNSDIYVDDVHIYTTTLTYADTTAPEAPSGIVATSAGSSITLTWTNGTDNQSGTDGVTILRASGAYTPDFGLSNQAVYHATNATVGPTTLNASTWKVVYQGPVVTTYTDNPGAAGNYTYLVFMRDKAGNYTSQSVAARAFVMNSAATASLSSSVALDGLYIGPGTTLTNTSTSTFTFRAGSVADIYGRFIHQGVLVNNGTINVKNGGTYQYDKDGGSIITPNWEEGSTCEITGVKFTAPNGLAQTFQHFIWNNDHVQAQEFPTGVVVNGNFTLYNGGPGASERIVWLNGTLTVKGNFSVTTNAEFKCRPGSYVKFTGSSLQTIEVVGSPCRFKSMEVDNSGAGVKLMNNVTLDSLCRLTTGAFDLNAYTFKHENNATIVKGLGTMTGGIFTPVNAAYVYNLTYERVNTTANELTSSTTYLNNLTINTPAGETVTLDKTASVNGELRLTSGKFQTGAYEIHVRNTATAAVTGNTTSSYVIGNLRRNIGTGSVTYSFPVGTQSHVENAALELNNLSGVSSIVTTFNSTITGAAPLCWVNGTRVNTLLNCGVWTVTPNAQPTSGTFTITTQGKGYTNPAASAVYYAVIKRDNDASPWKSVGTHANNTQSMTGGVVTAKRSGLSTFGDFAIGYGNAVLPITLSSFNAVKEGTAVRITWSTSAELNNAFFSLERSVNAVDFESINEQEGQGTSTVTHDYAYTDEHPVDGTNYYRLKQVDFDGTFTYSPVRQVSFATTVSTAPGQNNISVYPNPGTGIFHIANVVTSGTAQHAEVSVFDAKGQLVLKELINDNAPRQLDLNAQPPGTYMLQIMDANGQRTTKQLVIQR